MKLSRFAEILVGVALLAGPPAQAKVYNALKGESRLSYHLVHKMHEVTGVSENFRCAVDLAEDSLKSRIYVKAPIADFNSGNSSRDANMLEVLEVAKYPYVEFLSDSLRREGRDWRVFGRLSFHGVRRPVTFVVKPEVSADKIRVRGGFTVSLTEFKIERPRLLMIPVDDELGIDIDVAAENH